MKRDRRYMHRPGMRFDRRHINGPDAGFIGGDIDIVTTTGSVERSITEGDGAYRYETVPFAGYPRTASEMRIACLGKGNWVDGYLCDEYDSGLTSSFDATRTLFQTGSNIAFRLIGFRGPADDYAVGLSATGTLSRFTTTDPTRYAFSATTDLAFVWMAKQSSGGGTTRTLVNKYEGPAGGYVHNVSSTVSEIEPGVFTLLNTVDVNDQTGGKGSVYAYLPYNQWYIGMVAFERGTVNTGSFTGLNIETGRFEHQQYTDISTWTGSLTGIGDNACFSFGGHPLFNRKPPDVTVAAFYIASGTNAASGIFGNEEAILRNIARIVTARNGYLFSGSAEIDRSLSSFGNFTETVSVNQKLLGLGTASLGRSRGVTVITTGSVPSWTNSHIRNSAFVGTVLSSSDHETQTLGYYRSGSEALEQTAVPASASMYYSKQGKYQKVIVRKSASVEDLTRLPTAMDGMTPVYYVPGKGTDITSVTGTISYLSPTLFYNMQVSSILWPAMIPIQVPHSGKIVDIKVWVELAQTSGSTNVDSAGYYQLGNLGIALRSPNVMGFHAHPIRNDASLKRTFTADLGEFTAAGALGLPGRSLFGPNFITPFYRDSFILWEAPGFVGEGTTGPWNVDIDNGEAHSVTRKYPSWQRDRSMRTVFADGAAIANPRHHIGNPSSSYNGAPNSYFGINSAYGFDVPWTSETEISGAQTYVTAGSPPKGWLTGPGGSNATHEWPTTGVNYGAAEIQPLYPLLDPLYQRKRYGDVTRHVSTGSAIFDPDKWTGYRPGLRGTEVSGTWYLMVYSPRGSRRLTADYTPTYFRQVRLEFTLESGSYTAPRTRNQPRTTARRIKSEVLAMTISGSDLLYGGIGGWDGHISDTYRAVADDNGFDSEVGRTIGVGFLTGTIANTADLALYYALSGTIADLSGANPPWLFNNRFGMPMIPISSASLVETVAEPVVGMHPQEIMTARTIVDSTVRLQDAARDVNPLQFRAVYAAELISGTLT